MSVAFARAFYFIYNFHPYFIMNNPFLQATFDNFTNYSLFATFFNNLFIEFKDVLRYNDGVIISNQIKKGTKYGIYRISV